jgi:hypothetical protein
MILNVAAYWLERIMEYLLLLIGIYIGLAFITAFLRTREEGQEQ